jgi:hypothetical protein
MKTSKSIILPIIGMISVLICIGFAYKTNNVFLDKLLVCGFILAIVFIARMREIIQKSKLIKNKDVNKSLTKYKLKNSNGFIKYI